MDSITPELTIRYTKAGLRPEVITDIVSCYVTTGLYIDADTVTITFRHKHHPETLTGIQIKYGTRTVFNGIVDTVTSRFDKDGHLITVTGRGLAAKLINNETQPTVYYSPSIETIVKNHVTIHGFYLDTPSIPDYIGELKVGSSTSDWDVVKKFFWDQAGGLPYITTYGALCIRYPAYASSYLFSNTYDDPDAVRYSSVCIETDFRHLISDVIIVNSETGALTGAASDKLVHNMDMYRARYREYDPEDIFNAVEYYDEKLRKQHIKDVVYNFEIPGDFDIDIGKGITFKDPQYTLTHLLIAIKKQFVFDDKGLRTIVSAIHRNCCYF